MELYFSPLACSMATRVVCYETGVKVEFIAVNTQSKKLPDGSDFYTINPMGQVPALRTDTGELLTENPVVLQYVAEQKPESGLAPQNGIQRYRLQQWLNFITSELHKVVFMPLLHRTSPEGAKAYAREKGEPRFAYLNRHLDGRDYLLDRFTVADAYLIAVLNWTRFVGPDLTKWPAIGAYLDRMCRRPSVARAIADEKALLEEQQARRPR